MSAPLVFSEIALADRVNVVLEREVSVEPMSDVVGRGGVDLDEASWFAVTDAEGDVVCLVPASGAVHPETGVVVPDALATTIRDVINRTVPEDVVRVARRVVRLSWHETTEHALAKAILRLAGEE